MEIIRTTNLPARTKSRQTPIAIGRGIFLDRDTREALKGRVANGEADYGDLDELTAQLEEAGDSLEDEPTLDNFNTFKDSIGKFARKVTRVAYCIDKIFAPPQRSLLATRIIDEKGDYLYRSTMDGQNSHIQLASEIGDIKGMILKNCA